MALALFERFGFDDVPFGFRVRGRVIDETQAALFVDGFAEEL